VGAGIPRIRGHWWLVVLPDGDCHRELLESEEAAEFMLQAIQRRRPEAFLMRVRLMAACRPPGNKRKPKPSVTFWKLGRPKRSIPIIKV
jgi:hypothetical protein